MPLSRMGALILVDPDEAGRRILDALDKAAGNRTQAAKVLGVPVSTLHNWLAKLELWAALDAMCAAKGYKVGKGGSRAVSKSRSTKAATPKKR